MTLVSPFLLPAGGNPCAADGLKHLISHSNNNKSETLLAPTVPQFIRHSITMRPIVEVCIDSVESAKAAILGKADRLEVASALSLGGLTPSHGLLQAIRDMKPDMPIFAMIRPRSGDFCYTESEIQAMVTEIKLIKRDSLADGFVFGALTTKGPHVDVAKCQILMEECSPLPATFHRAFDLTENPLEAMEDIIRLGFRRILTSGQEPNAESGMEMIKVLVEKAANRIIILAGSGVNRMNVSKILDMTHVREIHTSASMIIVSKMESQKETVSMGKAGTRSDHEWNQTSSELVQCFHDIMLGHTDG